MTLVDGRDWRRLGGVHELLAFAALALLAPHIAAAAKHQVNRSRAAGFMPPFKARGEHPLSSSRQSISAGGEQGKDQQNRRSSSGIGFCATMLVFVPARW